jgi:succinoglycan biosynthesis protein ExoM
VIVVDNDASGSARQVITAIQERGCPFSLDYAIQPLRNIALTRNRTVELASGEWIAFVDDDERAPAEWLGRLLAAAAHYRADGVLGPVEPRLPANAPAWIQRGRFYDFPRMATGDPVPLNRMRFGNVVLRGSLLRAEPGPFDPHYGLTTGEDADLLIRLDTKGARIIWCDEAVVVEPIEPARLSLRWLVMRALSGGQEFARKAVGGRYGAIGLRGRMLLLAKSSAQLLAAAGLAGVSWPLGRHVAAGWLIRAAANLGKISVFWGWRYDEYA